MGAVRTGFGLASVGLAAITLAACNPAKIGEHRNEKPLATLARLDCPERQGALSRVSVASDGTSCQYSGDYRTVALRLLALNGRTPQTALGEVEAELKSALPPRAEAEGAEADGAEPADSDDGEAESNAADRSDDHARINLPGLHINTDGDKASISLPGIHINADGDKADVQVDKPGGKLAVIHADDSGAEIRTGDVTAKNVDATYLLASDRAGPDGEHAAGYVARGPVGGPLVVAVVRDKERRHGEHNGLHDVQRLIDHNLGRR